MLGVSTVKNKVLNLNTNINVRTKVILFVIVFTSTLLFRWFEYYNYRDLNTDKTRQLHGAYNLLNGKAVSFESYDLKTFSPSLRPIIDWPPAYSVLVAGVRLISGQDLYKSSIILDFITIALLWIVLLWIFNLLKINFLQSALLFFFLAISKTPLQYIFSADLIGTVLFLTCCAINISLVQKKIKKSVFYSSQFLLILLMAFLKYSLIPAIATLSVSLLSVAFFSKKKELYKPGLVLFAFVILSVTSVFLFNKAVSGDMVWMDKNNKEIVNILNFRNLLAFSPFLGITFFYPAPLYNILGYQLVQNALLVITFFILFLILFQIIKNVLKSKADYLEHLVTVTLIFVIGYLCMLSIYYPTDKEDVFKWTFVTEYRYFAPATFLVLIYILKELDTDNLKAFRSKFFFALVTISVFYAASLKIYYTLINNTTGSFESLHGKVVDVSNYLKNNQAPNTFFVSLSKNDVIDSQVTSLVAANGTKVAMSYYGYFPESAYSNLFSENEIIEPGKKVIIYFDENTSVLDSINKKNNFWIEKTKNGQQLLVIRN